LAPDARSRGDRSAQPTRPSRVLRRALARGRAVEDTIAAYRADLEQLARSQKPFEQIKERDLFAFLASRGGRPSSAARRLDR
jgi:hypothetical protein